LIAVFLMTIPALAYDAGRFEDVLRSSGFSRVEVGDLDFLSCDRKEFGRGFRAVNGRGHEVSGVVCCGILKRCTVRF
jgi:hypothetical protein